MRLAPLAVAFLVCAASRLPGQNLRWQARQTIVENDVALTLEYDLQGGCTIPGPWSGTQRFRAEAPGLAPVETTHDVSFTIPEAPGRFQVYADVAGIRWFGELSGDTLTLYNLPGPSGGVLWTIVGRIRGLPDEPRRPALDRRLPAEYRFGTIEWRIREMVREAMSGQVEEPSRTTVDQALQRAVRRMLDQFFDDFGISEDLQGRVAEAVVGACFNQIEDAFRGLGLGDEAEEALHNIIRAVRAMEVER
ncbi:MAG: hypothetical protein ACRELA_05940 [Candidatus Rokuibacteriota bacterium]